MSVACAVPEGASPPPEPPPRDYVESDGLRDDKIRARMEACKQGMMQLDALRSKHNRLMQEMRRCLPPIPGCVVVQARIKRSSEPHDRSSKESVDSAISTTTQSSPSRCSSPSISHRSSVSIDSGCSSVYSTDLPPQAGNIPYSTYRKLSVEERGLPVSRRDSHQSPLEPSARAPLPIVATTIASTTSMEGVERHWRRRNGGVPRPRSMYDKSSTQEQNDFERSSMVDSLSFSQITPPPVHRKLGIAQPPTAIQANPRSPLAPIRLAVNSSPSGHRRTPQKPTEVVVKAKAARVKSPDVVFHASRIFVDRSPPSGRRTAAVAAPSRRPRSLFEPRTEEPLYATPARVLVRERVPPSFAQATPNNRRTAFSPVVARVVSSYAAAAEKTSRGSGRVLDREWRESEGL